MMMAAALFWASVALAQAPSNLAGQVLDQDGRPLRGVSVRESRLDLAGTTDAQGRFELELPEGQPTDSLLLSFFLSGFGSLEVPATPDERLSVVMWLLEMDIFELSLEELMDVEVSVASRTRLSQRETPSIVTVVTRQEIVAAGCRDLIDVLRLVPGVEFGVDVEGIVGLVMRGSWAHEGKVLLMVDGMEMNELTYATNPLGNRFGLEQIERVEVVRGPGSALYGGFAEMGVINIITRKPQGRAMVSAGGIAGASAEGLARGNAHLSLGSRVNDKVSLAFHGYLARGNRSDRTYTDVYGDSYDMTGQSGLNNRSAHLQARIHGLNVQLLYDDYEIRSRDMYDQILTRDYAVEFRTMVASADYKIALGDKLSATPRLTFKQSRPWRTPEDPAPDELDAYMDFIYTDESVLRTTGNLVFDYQPAPWLDVVVGGEYFFDDVRNNLDPAEGAYWNGENRLLLQNGSIFGQALVRHRLANLTVGGRYDNHSHFEAAFAPRLALTKVFGQFHAKLMASGAFRSPSVGNINFNVPLNPNGQPDLRPERLRIYELEVGHKFSERLVLSANLFHMVLLDPIVFLTDAELDTEGFDNVVRTGTRGLELALKLVEHWGNANMSLAYYDAKGINQVPDYAVPTEERALLGTPRLSARLFGQVRMGEHLSLGPSASFMSERYAITYYDEVLEGVVMEKLPSVLIANLFVHYDDLLVPGLDLSLGVHDLLDSGYDFVQPYHGWHAPLPGPVREWVLRLCYDFEG